MCPALRKVPGTFCATIFLKNYMKETKNRILLIDPPFYRLYKDEHPYINYCYTNSLAYLAGTVKKETRWGVMMYHADFYPKHGHFTYRFLTGIGFENYLHNLKNVSAPIWQEVKATIQEYRPTVVGISCKTQTFASACLVAKLVKEIDERIMVVVGGPHVSLVGQEVLHCPEIDVGVKGEGENTLVEVLHAIDSQRELGNIKGIMYKKGGQFVENAPREFITDLDSLPFPHEIAPEVLKNYEQYPLAAFKNIFAIRGCPYNCFFCGSPKIWNRRVRFRSVENVIREIQGLQKKGLKRIRFDDDTFGINRRYIVDLCQALINHCPGLKWSCEMHVTLVDDEMIALMKKAGCRLIQLGIEAGNNEILRAIHKNITIEQALVACKIIRKHGIDLEAFFIIGFPQETEETLHDTINAMKKAKCRVTYSIYTPYPGTEGFEFCKRHGLIDENFDMALYNHQSPANFFCPNISEERFHMLASEIEALVDSINASIRKQQQPSARKMFLKKMRKFGVISRFKKGMKKVLNPNI